MGDSDFNDLLNAAEKLSADVEASGDLPKVDRTLRQVLEASTELWSKVTQSGAQDIQAHLLLGSKGLDLLQLGQKLDALSARKTFEPLEPACDTDIATYLKNEQENAILSIIEETHQLCFNEMEQHQWEHVKREWEQEKQNALNAFLGSNDQFIALTNPPEFTVMQDNPNLNTTGGFSRGSLSMVEMSYAKAIGQHIEAVVQGSTRISLLARLVETANSFTDPNVKILWHMLKIFDQVLLMRGGGDPIQARQQPAIQLTMINKSRKYLEDRYKKYMESVVASSMEAARRGGVPGTLSLVASFVSLHVPVRSLGLEDGLIDNLPLWPMIYFCLRCGDYAAAASIERRSGAATDELSTALEELANSSTDNSGRRLSTRTETQLRFHYRRHVRASTDPYKRIVYCALGACDVIDDHSEVAKTADDYLWLRLCQTQVSSESSDASDISELSTTDGTPARGEDRITYNQLQRLISEEFGETHYHAHEKPWLYFQMLLLTGQLEAAIGFLAKQDRLRVHAVHAGLALQSLGLLATSEDFRAPLLSTAPNDPPPSKRVNLSRLVLLHVRSFSASEPRVALHYYYLLRHERSQEGVDLFSQGVADLALETRDFSLILGQLDKNGRRQPGLLDEFKGVDADANRIIELAASQCQRQGLFEDAVELYDLSGDHEHALGLMAILMSQVVHEPNKPGALRVRLQERAETLSNRLQGQQINCSPETVSNFFALRDLLGFFDLYHQRDYQQALEALQKCKLIPLTIEDVEEKVNNFRRLGDVVCRTFPDVLLAAMNILYQQFQNIRGEDGVGLTRLEEPSMNQNLAFIRARARAITSFAGSVPYRLPGDTNSKLVQLEVLMH